VPAHEGPGYTYLKGIGSGGTPAVKENNMEELLRRITFNQNVLCGKPVIRGLRISVEMILELLAKGATEQEILEDYPDLEPDDVRAAVLYAHHMVAGETVLDWLAA
jgi:uncharacterized protein (DUF433 family)